MRRIRDHSPDSKALLLLLCLMLLTGCGRRTPAIIVLDAEWSRARAIPNQGCVGLGVHEDAYHDTCEARALKSFAEFSSALPKQFANGGECAGIQFATDDIDSNTLQKKNLEQKEFWKLRINYRAGTEQQEFDLYRVGRNGQSERETGGLVDLPYLIKTSCKTAREDGVHYYW